VRKTAVPVSAEIGAEISTNVEGKRFLVHPKDRRFKKFIGYLTRPKRFETLAYIAILIHTPYRPLRSDSENLNEAQPCHRIRSAIRPLLLRLHMSRERPRRQRHPLSDAVITFPLVTLVRRRYDQAVIAPFRIVANDAFMKLAHTADYRDVDWVTAKHNVDP
jgi:hypothetical protein